MPKKDPKKRKISISDDDDDDDDSNSEAPEDYKMFSEQCQFPKKDGRERWLEWHEISNDFKQAVAASETFTEYGTTTGEQKFNVGKHLLKNTFKGLKPSNKDDSQHKRNKHAILYALHTDPKLTLTTEEYLGISDLDNLERQQSRVVQLRCKSKKKEPGVFEWINANQNTFRSRVLRFECEEPKKVSECVEKTCFEAIKIGQLGIQLKNRYRGSISAKAKSMSNIFPYEFQQICVGLFFLAQLFSARRVNNPPHVFLAKPRKGQ